MLSTLFFVHWGTQIIYLWRNLFWHGFNQFCIRIYSNEVWICTFVTILIGIITLKIVAFLEKFLMKNELDSHFNSLTNNCGFVITILFQKPYRHLPRTFAIKSVHFGMIIMTFLLGKTKLFKKITFKYESFYRYGIFQLLNCCFIGL